MDQMHIEQLYQHVISVMTKEGKVLSNSQQLSKLKTNSQRVQIVYSWLHNYKLFPKIVTLKKDCETSAKFRNIGNGFFKRNEDCRALQNYNKAIMYAPNDSRELALAFGNRSAVLFHFKRYRECILDIERALKIGYEDDSIPKLLTRKLCCENNVLNQTDLDDSDTVDNQCLRQFRLSKERNPMIPCASRSLKLTYSEEMGRSVVAADNISPGEVLVVENPYCALLLESHFHKYCYSCLKQSFSMIPCMQCCSVMFCGDACRAKAWESYHRIECSLMPTLSVMKFTKIELLALRTVIQAKCTLSSWKAVSEVIREAESVDDPLMKGFTLQNNIETCPEVYVFDSNNYSTIHTLVTNVEKRSVSDIFQKSVTAAVCLHLLIEYTDFLFSAESSDDIEDKQRIHLAGGLLLHHNMTAPSNMHTISALGDKKDLGFVDDISFGGGAYGFLSLLNHSCAQNVIRYCNGSTIVLVALRPIKKGDQLFDNYGFHHATMGILERQKSLQFQYKFICSCEACVNNWPLFHELPRANVRGPQKKLIMHKIITDQLCSDLKSGDRSVALNVINQLYPYVIVLEKYAPNVELAEYQETIKQCWSLFSNIEYTK